MPQSIIYNCSQSRQRKHIVQTDEPNLIRRKYDGEFYVDDSQRIHNYDNLLMTKSNKKQTYISLIRGTGGM